MSRSADRPGPAGPLRGVRVIELAGLGPAPFGAMLLADLGADVIRVDRPEGRAAGNPLDHRHDLLARGRRSVALDLKRPAARDAVLRLVDGADVLIEGFRPGVTERLGLGPDVCLERNPRLVYGRMTGWGQHGPLASRAGHDINYIALAGGLDPIGHRDGPPVIPLNLVGDFGGGGMLLAFGVVAALLRARETGKGQVVDASIVDGTALLTTILHGLRAQGSWVDRRESNLLDGGAHFYAVYECADGKYLSVGAIEPQFYHRLLDLLGLADDPEFLAGHTDRAHWPKLRKRLADVFISRPRQYWLDLLGGTDTCVAPVLPIREAVQHPHNRARGTFVDVAGIVQPAPAPRFSEDQPTAPPPPPRPGEHGRAILAEIGLTEEEIERALATGDRGASG